MSFSTFRDEQMRNISPPLTHTSPHYMLQDSPTCIPITDLSLPPYPVASSCHSDRCGRTFTSQSPPGYQRRSLSDYPQPYHPLNNDELCSPGYQRRFLSDYPQAYHPLNNEDLCSPPPLPNPPISPWMDMPCRGHFFRHHKANELLEQLQHLFQVQQQQNQAQFDPEMQSMSDQCQMTNSACASCYRSKLSCDKQRPCSRCVKFGRECMSRPPVKLGRPRKKNSLDATPATRTSMLQGGVFRGGGDYFGTGGRCTHKKTPSGGFSFDPSWQLKVRDPDEFHSQTCESIASMDISSLEISPLLDFRQQPKPKSRVKSSPKFGGHISSRKRPWSEDNTDARSSSSSGSSGHGEVEFNLEGVIHDESFFEVSDAEWAELQNQSSSVRFAVLLTCEIARMSESLIENCSRNYMIVWSLCSVLSKQTKKLDFVRLLMRVWSTAYQSVFPRLIWNNEEDDSAQPDFHQLDNLSLTAALPPEIISVLDSRCVLTTTVVLEAAPEINILPFAVLRMWDVPSQDETLTTFVSYNAKFVQLLGYEGQEVVEIIQRCLFFEQVVLEEDWHILIKERVGSFCNHTPFMSICVRVVTKMGDTVPVVISFFRQWTGDRVSLTYAAITPVATVTP